MCWWLLLGLLGFGTAMPQRVHSWRDMPPPSCDNRRMDTSGRELLIAKLTRIRDQMIYMSSKQGETE